jgi:hypothetical protein
MKRNNIDDLVLKFNESAFNKTKIRDSIKDNYCSENNITLFRISYLDHDRIGLILNKIIKN